MKATNQLRNTDLHNIKVRLIAYIMYTLYYRIQRHDIDTSYMRLCIGSLTLRALLFFSFSSRLNRCMSSVCMNQNLYLQLQFRLSGFRVFLPSPQGRNELRLSGSELVSKRIGISTRYVSSPCPRAMSLYASTVYPHITNNLLPAQL